MKKKPKLAVIWPGYRLYNETFFNLLARDERFHLSVLWIIRFRSDEPPPAELLSRLEWRVVGAKNIRVNSYNFWTFLKLVAYVWVTVKDTEFVLTSTQAPIHSKLAFFFARLLRKKIFIIVEQWKDLKAQSLLMKIYKKFDSYLMKSCDRLFVHGTNQKKFALYHNVNIDRLRILPFLSNDLSFCTNKHVYLSENPRVTNKKIILYFGRIVPQKGLLDLLRAFAKIHNKIENIFLLICGGYDPLFLDDNDTGLYQRQCYELAHNLLDKDNFFFTGLINPLDKQNYFLLADLFVHPHTNLGELSDGWGLVLNEAASLSIPIITTDRVGSAPDLVHNGVNGFIVEAGNIDQLADKIELLMTDDEMRHQFSAASRNVFEQYHQPSIIADTLWEAMHDN